MKLFMLFTLLISTNVFADPYRHMVTFNHSGFGWSGAVERMKTTSESAFSDVESLVNNIGLNYAYRISERFQIGAYYTNTNSEYKFQKSSGQAEVEAETTTIGVFTLYNFSDTLSSAWYVGVSIGQFSNKQEVSKDIALEEGKSPFELDDSGMIYEVVVGKRFRLLKWNIDHLTFSPQIGFFHRTHGKDFDDQHVKDGHGISFQPIKFDLLF